MRLDQAAVFLDFDGTISERDIGVHLLERLGTGNWRGPGRRFRAGEITARECLEQEWRRLPRDDDLLRAVAREVPVDPGAAPLVEDLRAGGAEVTIVSDGFGFYVGEVAQRLGVPVLTNTVRDGDLVFSEPPPACPCAGCGTCKVEPIRLAAARGRRTILVGDATSDRYAAQAADVVFAKEELARWCDELGVDHVPFDHLGEVHAALTNGRPSLAMPRPRRAR